MGIKIILLSVLGALLLGVVSTEAQVVPLTQNRILTCSAYAEDLGGSDSGSDNAAAPDLGPFGEGVSSTIFLDNAYAAGSSHQTSSIAAALFDVVGGCAANGEGYDFDAWGDAGGGTVFQCSFEVTASTAYTLTGYLEASDNGSADLSLTGPGTSLSLDAGFNNILDLDETGTLEPGVYTFTVQANSSAYGDFFSYGYAFGGFDLELAFASPSTTPLAGGDGLMLSLSPNPFSQRTRIAYTAPGREAAGPEPSDVGGRLVRRLSSAGGEVGDLLWDGRNGRGEVVATGTYFVVLRSGAEVRREKVTLVR